MKKKRKPGLTPAERDPNMNSKTAPAPVFATQTARKAARDAGIQLTPRGEVLFARDIPKARKLVRDAWKTAPETPPCKPSDMDLDMPIPGEKR